jgi:hypothetical protein
VLPFEGDASAGGVYVVVKLQTLDHRLVPRELVAFAHQ